MKKYLTPSIEINKFDVEDIITTSTQLPAEFVGTGLAIEESALTQEASILYTEFKGTNTVGSKVVEFQW